VREVTEEEFEEHAREMDADYWEWIAQESQREAQVVAALVEACRIAEERPHLTRIQSMLKAFDGRPIKRQRLKELLADLRS
jgi:hypothetical protein